MSADRGLLRYPERALESTTVDHGLTPTRLLAVLFPVRVVEVEATVTEGEPYAVIDQYVERAIAEGRITTDTALADFLGLELPVVRRAVRFLRNIGHVIEGAGSAEGAGGQLKVTDLGLRSLREKVRYTVTVRDRRKLYFDGLTSAPMTRPYYDSRTVTLLDAEGARAAQARRQGPRFHLLYSLTELDPQALTRLAANPRRDHFNLPERINQPRAVGPVEVLHLPLHVVRAVGTDARPRYLAYSQAGNSADPDLEPMVLASQAPALLETEVELGRAGQDEKQAQEWLRKRDLSHCQPKQSRHDTWQVDIPPAGFEGDNGVALSKIGSYALLGTGFLRLWCDSKEMRERALLRRVDSYLSYRARPSRTAVETQVDRIARQLELGAVDLTTLARRAKDFGNRALSAQLSHLSSSPTDES